MAATDISRLRCPGRSTNRRSLSCVFSSPARPAGSAPSSSPNSSAPAITSSGWPARTPPPPPSPRPGAKVHRGTLDDLDNLRRAADASDGVIHVAFKHDIAFSGDFQGTADADRRAVETFARPWPVLTDRSSSPPGPSGSLPGGWRPNATATVPTPLPQLWAAVPRPGGPLPSWCSASLPAASARQLCDSLRPFTSRTLRLAGRLPRPRQPRLQHPDPQTGRLAPHPSRAHQRPRPRPLLPQAIRMITLTPPVPVPSPST